MGIWVDALELREGGVIALTGAGGKTSLMYRLAGELAAAGETALSTTTTRIYPPDPSQSPALIVAERADSLIARAAEPLRHHRHLTVVSGRSEGGEKRLGLPPEEIDALASGGPFRWIIVEADGAAGRPLKAPADHEPVIPASARWVIALVGLSALGRPLTERWVHRPERFSALTGLPAGSAITAAAIARLLTHPLGALKGAPSGCQRIIVLNQADDRAALSAGDQIAGLLRRERSPGGERILIGRLRPEPAVLARHAPAIA